MSDLILGFFHHYPDQYTELTISPIRNFTYRIRVTKMRELEFRE